MSETKTRIGHESDKRCPKCGATLLVNDFGQEWCTLVRCNYGITHDERCPALMMHDCTCGYKEAHSDKAA